MSRMKFVFALYAILICGQATASTDLLIFSKDRPMQLYALLESVGRYVSGLNKVTVLYRTSSSKFDSGYQIVKNDFAHVDYIQQAPKPAKDFWPLTQKAIFDSPAPYIMFAVDDDMVVDEVDCDQCTQLLDAHDALYGFYLRLGSNICHSYAANKATPVPPLQQVATSKHGAIYYWQFKDQQGGWGYPNTVDMTIYRKRDVQKVFDLFNGTIQPKHPNDFEGWWHGYFSPSVMPLYGLCFHTSKIINVPANVVSDWNNRHENSYSADELLRSFVAGYKIDIAPLHKFEGNAPHVAVNFSFIKR